jgi:hypothetical protein
VPDGRNGGFPGFLVRTGLSQTCIALYASGHAFVRHRTLAAKLARLLIVDYRQSTGGLT